MSQLVLMIWAPLAVAAPARAPGVPGSHDDYVRDVKSAGSAAFRKALAVYDNYLARSPGDAVAAVERCKLIAATAPDDEVEPDDQDANEREELNTGCGDWLAQRFPDAKAALAYRLDLQWGEAAVGFAHQLLADPRLKWTDQERAHFFQKLASIHEGEKRLAEAAVDAQHASELDPTLDLTTTLGAQLVAEGRLSEAIVVLSSRPDGEPFQLMRKAQLLADAGSPRRALWLIGLAPRNKQRMYVSPSTHAAILERAGEVELARKKYTEQRGPWNRRGILSHLFAIDLNGGNATSAEQSYQALRDLGWRADPVAGYRLELARKFPSLKWRARDALGLLGLLAVMLGCLLLPGLWVVPLHYWSLWRRLRGPLVVEPALDTRWGIVHLWLASATFLLVQFLGLILFGYADVVSWFAPTAQKSNLPGTALAAIGLWNAVGPMVVLGILLVRRKDLHLFGPGTWSLVQCLGGALKALGIVLVVALLTARAFSLSPNMIGIDEIVRSVRQTYGLGAAIFVVVVAAPLAEELVFRSVLFDVLARYLPAALANAVQALAFAAAHGELRRVPYLFVLGLLAGSLRRKSGGLFASISLHAANNALAILLTLSAVAPTVKPPKSAAPFEPSQELLSCVRAESSLAEVAPEQMRGVGGPTAILLNRVAWAMAINPATTPACLRRAEEAVNGSLQQIPEVVNYLDTKAVVYYRQGRFDEAIDLERAVIDLDGRPIFYSELDRFLRRLPSAAFIGEGSPAPVTLALAPPESGKPLAIHVALGDQFPDGVQLYARIVDANRPVGLFRAAFGPGHERSYELVSQTGVLSFDDGVRFEIALIDARGCDRCPRAGWSWEYQPHDPAVDGYQP